MKEKNLVNKKILAGLSGGTASAVTAALLKTQGYDIQAVYMQFCEHEESTEQPQSADKNKAAQSNPAQSKANANLETITSHELYKHSCCENNNAEKVKAICKHLEIPFHLMHVENEFRNDVLDYLIHEKMQARLPNPCIKCHSQIKIRQLIKKADQLKCDFIATGHYAKTVTNPDGTETNLYRATDKSFDQSYFLYDLKQNELMRLLMPLGDLLKSNIEKMAITFNLDEILTPESKTNSKISNKKSDEKYFLPQNPCFLKDQTNLERYLSAHSSERHRPAGPIVDTEGKLLGRHSGLYKYYLGQTENIEFERKDPAHDTVIGFDLKVTALIAGKSSDLLKQSLVAVNCNWIGILDFSQGLKCQARLSTLDSAKECRVTLLNNNTIWVVFEEKQKVIPGQSIVFYNEDLVIGGGIIETATSPNTTKLSAKN